MPRPPTKRALYPLAVTRLWEGSDLFLLRNDDPPDHAGCRRVFLIYESKVKAVTALRAMYRRVALPEPIARTCGVHPLASLPAYADGGYPWTYASSPAGGSGAALLCVRCAEKERRHLVAAEIYWEGPELACEQCGRTLPSAYGDPAAEPLPTPEEEEQKEDTRR